MPAEWRSAQFATIADGTTWAFSDFVSPGYSTLWSVNPGEAIRRTRITGQILVGCKTIDPTTFVPGEFITGANQLTVGVYYAGPEGLNWPPPSPNQSPGDGGWLMRCQLQQVSLTTMVDVNSLEYYWAVYNIPSDCINSEAERGPATLASQIGLTWTFFNPNEEIWTVHTSDQLGLISAAFTIDTLFRIP